MNTITTIFTCAAAGNAAPGTSPGIFWLMFIILILDEDARHERERRRERDQAHAQALSKPKPPAGPR